MNFARLMRRSTIVMLSAAQQQELDLEQVRWRVRFHRSLLDAHRQFPLRGYEWARTEAKHLEDLKHAKEDLFRLEHPDLENANCGGDAVASHEKRHSVA